MRGICSKSVVFGLVGHLLGLVDAFVVALGQRVDDGEDEIKDHQYHKLLEDPTQNISLLKKRKKA